jgi:hypothetical protein
MGIKYVNDGLNEERSGNAPRRHHTKPPKFLFRRSDEKRLILSPKVLAACPQRFDCLFAIKNHE